MKQKLFITLALSFAITAHAQKDEAKAKEEKTPAKAEIPKEESAKTVAPKVEKSEAETKGALLSGIIEDYTYKSEGKRDPFAPYESQEAAINSVGPVFPLQRFDLDQLKLVGIIWDVSHPKAMLMDPANKGHVVKVNDRIGRNNGYVARIREGEIVVIESFKSNEGKASYQTRVIKLSSE